MLQKRGNFIDNRIFINSKRAQLTLFIIGAIVIIIIAVLLFLLVPGLQSTLFGEVDPQNALETCITPQLEENLVLLTTQGGSLDPENFILYRDNKVGYLCYPV